MTVEIRQHEPGKDLKDFMQIPYEIYRDDPAWVAPLKMEVRERLTPGKNPFFGHAEAALFTAHRNGKVVGRISAQVDREHLRVHDDGAGFFGFFDTIDDQEVATALLSAAEEWLAGQGASLMRGPMSLSINEEVGMLVEGFDTPPAMMMQHHSPYQGGLAEGAGLHKAVDLFAWHYKVEEPPARAEKAWKQMQELPEVRFRSLNKRRLKEDIDVALEIFNDAWKQNWGFVPATEAEAEKMAKDLALVLDPDLSFFVEIDGRPMAMVFCLPNINEVVYDFDGKLTPINIGKLVWRLKVKRPKSARLIMLGIRTELRGIKRYGALSTSLYAEIAKRGMKLGYEWAELSWTLEDNRPINLGIKSMRARVYKRYRIYEKPIGAS